MSMNPDNVLTLALANDELDRFLVGEPFYFLEARSDNEEPQNVSQAFDQLLMPYWRATHDPDLPFRFIAALLKILATYPDRNRAIYVARTGSGTTASACRRNARIRGAPTVICSRSTSAPSRSR